MGSAVIWVLENMKRLDALLNDSGIDDEISIIKIRYALEIIKNEAIKLSLLLMVFIAFGNVIEYLFTLAILLPLRAFSGGFHMKTNIGYAVSDGHPNRLSWTPLPRRLDTSAA